MDPSNFRAVFLKQAILAIWVCMGKHREAMELADTFRQVTEAFENIKAGPGSMQNCTCEGDFEGGAFGGS